jgi:phosphate starvation-inducible PhoH-like protein
MELLADQAEGGCSLTPDTIRVFHDSLKDPESGAAERIKSAYIQIPSGPRIKPRTYPQAAYIQGMKSRELVFSIGPGGTGKTFLAVAHALQEILEKRKKKLVLTRPVVEAGENLGFLPGDLSQKLNPYLRPLYDAMDRLIPAEMIQRMEENRVIELAPLAYMRGRSLENAYIILDEAQNTTREQMKMFLTRMGEGSRMVVTGDITQIDLPDKSHSGLVQVRDLLKPLDEIGFYYFTSKDVIRHPLVRKIIEIYEKNK